MIGRVSRGEAGASRELMVRAMRAIVRSRQLLLVYLRAKLWCPTGVVVPAGC